MTVGLDDDIAILSAAPLFRFMGRDALRLLCFAAERRSLAAGDVLYARDERADGGFVVLTGAIAVAPRRAGGEPVVAGPSALIGRLSLFLRGERPSEARASVPSEVLRITPTLMRRVLQEFPDAAAAIEADLTEDLVAFTRDLDGVRPRFEGP